MAVQFTKSGRLILAKLSHEELCAIEAFLDHCWESHQRMHDTSLVMESSLADANGMTPTGKYVGVIHRYIKWMYNQMEQLPNWKAMVNANG